MLTSSLQCAAFTILALYFSYWRAEQRRLDTQSWESLNASLDHLKHEDSSTRSALWTMFKRGGILLRIADYADRHRAPIDSATLAQLRDDALYLRLTALLALARLRFPATDR